jgi:hypothetical protein
MNLDEFIIILRCLILMVLAIISQLAFHRRQFKVMFWSLGFWITIFRLLTIRVLKVYAHQDDPNIQQLQITIMSGLPSLITDIVLVVTALPLYIWIKDTYKVWLKTTKKL